MSTSYRPTGGIHVRIEQAIARGDDLEQICRDLDVEPARIDKVMRHLDAAIAENDQPAAVPYVRSAPVAPCGTPAAYARHATRREPIDDACRAAHLEYRQQRRGLREAS